MAACPAIPVAASGNINDIKLAYILTQAMLIDSCEKQAEFIEWWDRTHGVQ